MMEFEYRKLSEEKANEIDAYGFTDWQGKKIEINDMYSVTNTDETIVFQQTYYSHDEDVPNKYLLVYKDSHYFLDIFLKNISGKVVEDNNYWYYQFKIKRLYGSANNIKEYSKDEIITVLKEVLFIWYQYGKKKRKIGDRVFVELIDIGE